MNNVENRAQQNLIMMLEDSASLFLSFCIRTTTSVMCIVSLRKNPIEMKSNLLKRLPDLHKHKLCRIFALFFSLEIQTNPIYILMAFKKKKLYIKHFLFFFFYFQFKKATLKGFIYIFEIGYFLTPFFYILLFWDLAAV